MMTADQVPLFVRGMLDLEWKPPAPGGKCPPRMSAIGGRAENICSPRVFRILTRLRHQPRLFADIDLLDSVTDAFSPLGPYFSHFYRILLEHGDPLACEFCNDAENFKGRPNRRKPLGEFKSQLHVGLRHFQ